MSRAVIVAVLALALTGCGTSRSTDPANPTSVDLVYVHLNDGRTLECISSHPNGATVFDCNWDHPIGGAK